MKVKNLEAALGKGLLDHICKDHDTARLLLAWCASQYSLKLQHDAPGEIVLLAEDVAGSLPDREFLRVKLSRLIDKFIRDCALDEDSEINEAHLEDVEVMRKLLEKKLRVLTKLRDGLKP